MYRAPKWVLWGKSEPPKKALYCSETLMTMPWREKTRGRYHHSTVSFWARYAQHETVEWLFLPVVS